MDLNIQLIITNLNTLPKKKQKSNVQLAKEKQVYIIYMTTYIPNRRIDL